MVQNHALQHFAIYPPSSTEEFWVFLLFFLVYLLLPLTCCSTSEMTAIFCGVKEEERGKETPKKKKKRDLSLKSVGNNASLCINKTKSNTLNTHWNIGWGISDLPHCFPPAQNLMFLIWKTETGDVKLTQCRPCTRSSEAGIAATIQVRLAFPTTPARLPAAPRAAASHPPGKGSLRWELEKTSQVSRTLS